MEEKRVSRPQLTTRFLDAIAMALEIHGQQVRKASGIPYVSHLISVSALVLEYGETDTEDAAIAAILHDAVEDSRHGEETEKRIRTGFGDAVADIVLACSDTVGIPCGEKPPWKERKSRYLEHLRGETNAEVLLVSACDKLHNLRSIVLDLRATGESVWGNFREPAISQFWYYGEFAKMYREKIPTVGTRRFGILVGDIDAEIRTVREMAI